MKEWKDKVIDIFGTKYKVVFVPSVWSEIEGHTMLGSANSELKLIKVALRNSEDKVFSDDEILNTFLHELVHAIFGEGCYSSTEDEPLVEWTAKCLRSLIKQKVFTWNT